MSFKILDLGIAASIFLALYVLYNVSSIYIFIKKGWKSVYTFLLIYGLIRVGGQISGVGYAAAGYYEWKWLIAYLIMSAEGYFTLVLSTLYFLVKEQMIVFGKSPLMKPLVWKMSYRVLFHYSLIPANAMIIAGGCMLTGLTPGEKEYNHQLVTSKALRSVGLIIFLLNSLSVAGLTLYNYFVKRLRTKTMIVLMFIIPFITVRGIYGILSIFYDEMSYFKIQNYFDETSSAKLTIYEYTLALAMEFITAFSLLSIYWLKRWTHEVDAVPKGDAENLTDKTNEVATTYSDETSAPSAPKEHGLAYRIFSKTLIGRLVIYLKNRK